MGIKQVDGLNQKRFEKREEVEIFLNHLNNIFRSSNFDFDIEEKKTDLRGLIEKFGRDTINISIVSEVSSGKSTFLNALIFDEPVLESKIGETTAKIFNIKYGEKFSINGVEKVNLKELKSQISLENSNNLKVINQERKPHEIQSVITLPNENLKRGIELYDTPGFATVNEQSMLVLIKEAISKSDATVLLLDISQGIKNSEKLFIKNMLHKIPVNKRFIVLNKYDSIIDEDDLALKSKEDIDKEIKNLIENVHSTLKNLQKDSRCEIETHHISAKKALVGKMKNDSRRIEESRFALFEDTFWRRVVDAKDEIFEDSVILFKGIKDELIDNLKIEKKRLIEDRISLELKLETLIKKEAKISTIIDDIDRLKIINDDLVKIKQKTLIELEQKLITDIKDILSVNLDSELTDISILDKLTIWTLKSRYQDSIVSVVENARSYIIENIKRFIKESINESLDVEKNDMISIINRDLDIIFFIQRYNKEINLEHVVDRVVTRINGYVEWTLPTLFALLKHNIVQKKDKELDQSYIELSSEIHRIKRDINNFLLDSRDELDEYIILVKKTIEEMKENSLNNKESLKEEIKELSLSIAEIEYFFQVK
jgi:hypothetical protein